MLFVVILLGCSSLGCSAQPVKEPRPIPSPFPYSCDGPYKDKELSKEDISKELRAHRKWLADSKDPEGHQANFCGAKLPQSLHDIFQGKDIDLRSANFQMAMLAGANFTDAKLNDAKLQGANLSGAKFINAHLIGAELDDAMLHGAIFQKAHLRDTSLHHAMLHQAKLEGVDLTDVKKSLTQSQINMACLNKKTKLPKGLKRLEPPC